MKRLATILFLVITLSSHSQFDSTYIALEEINLSKKYRLALEQINNELDSDSFIDRLKCYSGIVYLLHGDSGKYVNNYLSGLEIDSLDKSSNFRIGEIYYISVKILIDCASDGFSTEYLTKQQKYLLFMINRLLEIGLPYYERAYAIDSDDQIIKERLIEFYTRLKYVDKLELIKET
jgi:hypothetical protein